MKAEPLISVIIPVYNGEKYLKECIEMMLNQSYKSLEIIVVNDGSTDESKKIAKQYPVKLITLPVNRGLSVARNTGIDAAQGDYVHFMDVDDALNADFYKELAAAVAETNADMACTGMINELKPHRTMLFEERKTLESTAEKLKITNVGRWGYSVRYLYKKSFLNEHNIRFEEGRMIEDMPFSLTAVYFCNKLVLVPNAVYTYIRREDSIMTRRDKAHYKKKHQDMRHAKEYRHNFANEHNFRIPGVQTWGRISLLYEQWLT